MKKLVFGMALIVGVTTTSALADEDQDRVLRGGAILLHLGVYEPRGNSDLWDFNDRILTQDVTDFDEAIGGLAFASRLNSHFDWMIGGQYYNAETTVHYRDIFTVDGAPIRQHHRLRMVPIDVSFKFLPVRRDERRGRRGRRVPRPVVPYLGGGAGALLWDYEERGRFVDDVENPTLIFHDRRAGRGVTGSYHALAGVELQFTREFAIWMEGRYRWAKADLGSDFPETLDRFDLSGGNLALGASIRF